MPSMKILRCWLDLTREGNALAYSLPLFLLFPEKLLGSNKDCVDSWVIEWCFIMIVNYECQFYCFDAHSYFVFKMNTMNNYIFINCFWCVLNINVGIKFKIQTMIFQIKNEKKQSNQNISVFLLYNGRRNCRYCHSKNSAVTAHWKHQLLNEWKWHAILRGFDIVWFLCKRVISMSRKGSDLDLGRVWGNLRGEFSRVLMVVPAG